MRMVCRETSEFESKQDTDLIQNSICPKKYYNIINTKQDAIEARISSDVVPQPRDIHHLKPEKHK